MDFYNHPLKVLKEALRESIYLLLWYGNYYLLIGGISIVKWGIKVVFNNY